MFSDADVQKVKDAALKKMAIAFNTHKKTVWANYLANERKTPEFTGTLEKQREHWDDFVTFRDSEISMELRLSCGICLVFHRPFLRYF